MTNTGQAHGNTKTAPEPVVTQAAVRVPAPAPALSPLATYLRSYLNTLRRQPVFARLIPQSVASIGVNSGASSVVFLLDARDRVVGRIEPYRENGRDVANMFIATTMGVATPFHLDLTRPPLIEASAAQAAASEEPLLLEPAKSAPRPACASFAGVGCR